MYDLLKFLLTVDDNKLKKKMVKFRRNKNR